MTGRMFQRLGIEDEVGFALGRNRDRRFEPQCRVRASQVEHSVEDLDRGGDLSGSDLVAVETQPVTDSTESWMQADP